MKKNHDTSTDCVVRDDAIRYSSQSPEDCTVIESVKKLMALGLSAREIEELDIRQSTLQAICELARLEGDEADATGKASDAIAATLRAIGDQVNNLDLEIEMLKLRKGALRRRTTVLEKLAKSLAAEHEHLLT